MLLRIFFYTMCLSCFSITSFAQDEKGRITGSVVDSVNNIIDGASVSLWKEKDSSLVKTAVTNRSGIFEFENLQNGSYRISITAVGFLSARTNIVEIKSSSPTHQLQQIKLQRNNSSLEQVTVTGKRPFIEQRIDRTIVNVDAAITNVGATALEVLEKSPGVSVNKDGVISLKGKQGVTVMLDGKPSYLSGSDLINLLTNMNANQLDQIEIMTNPPAKYDAAGNSGIINIKTKKNKAKGFNGNITAAYGQGKYWKTSNSLNLNYRNGSYNLFLNYSMNAGEGYTDLHITRKYVDADGKTVNSIFDEPTYFKFHNTSNNLKLGMDYYLNQKTTIGFTTTGFISPRKTTGSSTGYLNNADGHTDSVAHTTQSEHSKWLNGTVNLNFRHQFDSVHELTADADYIRYNGKDSQLFINQSYYPDGTITSQNQLKGYLPSDIKIYSGKMDYSQSFKNNLKLDAGWKSSWVTNDNASDYFTMENNIWEPDYGKTNHFIYKENINAIYANINTQIKKWSLQLGSRFENTNYKGHQTGNPEKPDSSFKKQYNNIFPTAFISYALNTKNQFTLSIGRRIDRPAYQDLNPFLFFINQYTYSVGNPFLSPQYTNNFELSHIFKGIFTTTLSYSKTENYFTQLFRTEGNTTILGLGNLGDLENFGISLNAQLEITKWWSATLHTDLNYKKVNGFTNGSSVQTEAANAQFNSSNQFNFKKGWSAELSGFYNTKDVEGQFTTKPFGQVSAGISKLILKNKATVKLSVRDIFYTQTIYGAITYQNVRENFIQSRDARVVNLSFNYRFGKPLKEARKRTNGGAAEEQNRVKVG